MSHSARRRFALVVPLAALLSTLALACGGQTVGSGDGNGPTADGGSPDTGTGTGPGGGGTCNLARIIPPVILVTDATTGTPICNAVLVDNNAGADLSPVTCSSGTGCSHSVCEYTVLDEGGSGSTFSVTVSAPGYGSTVVDGLMTSYCGCDTSQCAAAQTTNVTLTPVGDADAGGPPDASAPPTDGGSSGGGGCPSTEPNGSAVPCGNSTLQCEYGTDPNPGCNRIYTCGGGVWQINFGGDECPSSPGTCPASYGAASGSCGVENQTCQYGAGTCICSTDPSGLPTAGGPVWACIPTTSGCPTDRPDLGSACPNGSPDDCDYGQCIGGLGETCADGYWVEAETVCPA